MKRAFSVASLASALAFGLFSASPVMAGDAAPHPDAGISATSGGTPRNNPPDPKISLRGPKTSPSAGEAFRVRGRIKSDGAPRAKVKIKRKRGTKWVSIAATKTNRRGKYAVTVRLSVSSRAKLRAQTAKPQRLRGLRSKTLRIQFLQPVRAPDPGGTGSVPEFADPKPSPVPLQPLPAVPGIVPDVSAVAGKREIQVTWSAPTNGSSPVTGYQAVASPGGGMCEAASVAGCTITDLTNGVTYTVTVSALNEVGRGPASSASPPASPFRPDVCTIDGSPQFGSRSISGAIAAAEPGATLNIQGRCVDSDLEINQELTLRGLPTGDDRRHVVDANQQGRVLLVGSAGSLTLDGELSITGGTSEMGGGIYVESGVLDIRGDVELFGNSATTPDQNYGDGGAIFNSEGTVTLAGQTRILSNNAVGGGGGLFSLRGSVSLGDGVIVAENNASSGGGIFNSEGQLSIDGSSLRGNVAENSGGAVGSNGSLLLSGDTEIANNSATVSGGGIYQYALVEGISVEISGALRIVGNTAAEGAGLDIWGGYSVEISGAATIVENRAIAGNGGGIRSSVSALRLANVTMRGNGAGGNGGGLYHHGGDLTVEQSTIAENSAGGDGGGIYSDTTGLSAITGRTQVFGNEAGRAGGGLCLQRGGEISENVRIFENVAENGGGATTWGTLTVTTVGIFDNVAEVGGGIFNGYSLLLLQNAEVARNRSWTGAGIDNLGGEVVLKGSTKIIDNVASGPGGAVWNESRGTVTLLDSTRIEGNQAEDGGGIYNMDGSIQLNGGTVTKNTAIGDGQVAGGINAASGQYTSTGNVSEIVFGNTPRDFS